MTQIIHFWISIQKKELHGGGEVLLIPHTIGYNIGVGSMKTTVPAVSLAAPASLQVGAAHPFQPYIMGACG
jgi:hypothetical protein